jgi:hypothetical protein
MKSPAVLDIKKTVREIPSPSFLFKNRDPSNYLTVFLADLWSLLSYPNTSVRTIVNTSAVKVPIKD